MKTLYVSDDGKFFTTIKECIEYEVKQEKYSVKVMDVDLGEIYLTQCLENKQDCQHFVAEYIHNLLESFDTEEEMKKFFIYTKITVYHKNYKTEYNLMDLVKRVPAHYKINSEKFDDLIR